MSSLYQNFSSKSLFSFLHAVHGVNFCCFHFFLNTSLPALSTWTCLESDVNFWIGRCHFSQAISRLGILSDPIQANHAFIIRDIGFSRTVHLIQLELAVYISNYLDLFA